MLFILCLSGFKENLLKKFGEIVKEHVKEQNGPLLRIVNALCSAKPVSTVSDRNKHQKEFKEKLRLRYECCNPENPAVTKCMILNHFFSTQNVTASHIVGLHERQLCAVLGFTDVWGDRNGILLYKEIGKHFEHMELVSFSVVDSFVL